MSIGSCTSSACDASPAAASASRTPCRFCDICTYIRSPSANENKSSERRTMLLSSPPLPTQDSHRRRPELVSGNGKPRTRALLRGHAGGPVGLGGGATTACRRGIQLRGLRAARLSPRAERAARRGSAWPQYDLSRLHAGSRTQGRRRHFRAPLG